LNAIPAGRVTATFPYSQTIAGLAVVLYLAVGLAVAIKARTVRGKPETPYEKRAWFLFNFANVTEWPKEAFIQVTQISSFSFRLRSDKGCAIEPS